MKQRRLGEIAPQTKESDEYRTPPEIVKLVIAALGGEIGLDPCAEEGKAIPARHHFTAKDNCLAQSWGGLGAAFVNPPFSSPEPFLEKAWQEIAARRIPKAIFLLRAGALNNKGTGRLIKERSTAACLWIAPRINFLKVSTGSRGNGANFDCAFVFFGSDPDLFLQVFEPRGIVFRTGRSINHPRLGDAVLGGRRIEL